MNKEDLIKFIVNSNEIENVYDKDEILLTQEAWEYLEGVETLTKETILKVHRYILKKLNPRIAGKYRNCWVRVGDRVCPDPYKVEPLIDGWIYKYGDGINDEEDAKQAHIDFEKIHPFEDGNGRVGRLLWLWHREKAGLPFEYIKKSNISEYYRWFIEKNIRDIVDKLISGKVDGEV